MPQETPHPSLSRSPFDVPFDVDQLERAWHLLRAASLRFDHIARQQGWPVPFAPVRALLLARLEQATAYGLSARRLAGLCRVTPSTLAYHLDALEGAGLIRRVPWTIGDRRKVAVRLTPAGSHAAHRLLPQPPMRSPAIASP
jgi:DNA-binding MarR family transcriptional regulator